MFENFGNIKNVLSISDGIIGYKEDGSDYNQVLNELFQRVRERNCKLNPNKIVTHTTDEKQMATGKNPAKSLGL